MIELRDILTKNDKVMDAVEEIYEAGYQAGLQTNCKGVCLSNLELSMPTEELNKYAAQRDRLGFDDTEFFDFRETLAKFLTPRFKRMLEILDNGGEVGLTREELESLIEGFGYMCVDMCELCGDYETVKRHKIVDSEKKALQLLVDKSNKLYAFTE